MNYENPVEISQLFDLVKLILKERGKNDICNLLSGASISIINTVDSRWCGGDMTHTVQIKVGVKTYSSFPKFQIELFESNISECFNEITKVDDSTSFLVKIIPSLQKKMIETTDDISPELKELRQNIDTIRGIMVSVATGGDRIQNVNERYQILNSTVKSTCNKLGIPFYNPFESLWDWYGKWKADFPKYQERREYIRDLFAQILSEIEAHKESNVEVLVQLDDWTRIKRTIDKIKSDCQSAQNEEDFQSVGLLCRDVLISLAQAVYDANVHGETDEQGTRIGNSDAVRMIGTYFSVVLKGKQTKELRDYAKATNAIANQLTHKRTATRTDMLLTMSSTIALINFIGILEGKI